MGSRWVYRRPFFRANRPKIPLDRADVSRQVVVRIIRRSIRRRRWQQRRRFVPQDAPQVVNNKAGAFRRAIARIRRMMHARLRWIPRKEPSLPELGVPQNPKGIVVGPGLLRGVVARGGE